VEWPSVIGSIRLNRYLFPWGSLYFILDANSDRNRLRGGECDFASVDMSNFYSVRLFSLHSWHSALFSSYLSIFPAVSHLAPARMPLQPEHSVNYTYDAINRLTQVSALNGTGGSLGTVPHLCRRSSTDIAHKRSTFSKTKLLRINNCGQISTEQRHDVS
jgi:hypothetical protein